jgi:hypothetical protein
MPHEIAKMGFCDMSALGNVSLLVRTCLENLLPDAVNGLHVSPADLANTLAAAKEPPCVHFKGELVITLITLSIRPRYGVVVRRASVRVPR